jgi:hypothetical protein
MENKSNIFRGLIIGGAALAIISAGIFSYSMIKQKEQMASSILNATITTQLPVSTSSPEVTTVTPSAVSIDILSSLRFIGSSTPFFALGTGEGGYDIGFYSDGARIYEFQLGLGMDETANLAIVPLADPDSFIVLGGGYTKDKHSVYYLAIEGGAPTIDGTPSTPIGGADSATFSYLGGGFAKDKNHAYLNQQVFSQADPASFAKIDNYFAKDNNAIYASYQDGEKDCVTGKSPINDCVVKGADPTTFVSLGRGYGKDKTAVYNFSSGKVVGADLDSFVSLKTPENLGYGPDAKDKNGQYSLGKAFAQ